MLRRNGLLVAVILVSALALMGFVRTDKPDAPQSNVDIVLSLIDEVWNQGDLTRVPDFYASSYAWHGPTGASTIASRPCACAFKLLEMLSEDLVDTHLEVENVIAQDDFVVAHYTFVGRPRGWSYDSIHAEEGETWSGILMYRLSNSKVVEEWWYWDNTYLQ